MGKDTGCLKGCLASAPLNDKALQSICCMLLMQFTGRPGVRGLTHIGVYQVKRSQLQPRFTHPPWLSCPHPPFTSSLRSGIYHDFLRKNSPWGTSHKPKKCQRRAESTVQPPSKIKWENHTPHRSVSAIQEKWVTFWMPRTHYRFSSSVFKFLTSYFILLG